MEEHNISLKTLTLLILMTTMLYSVCFCPKVSFTIRKPTFPFHTCTQYRKLCPPPPLPTKGWVAYCFWCGFRQCRHPCSFMPALYLLNQWVDFDQTCTDTLMGGGKEVFSFWWHWPHFQGHTSTLKFSNFDPKKVLSTPYLLNQMTDSAKRHILIL